MERAVKAALEEDLGLAGDITTQATVDENALANAAIVARVPGRIAGLQCAQAAFRACNPQVKFETAIADGADAGQGGIVFWAIWVLMFFFHWRTWPTVVIGMGATPPRRWHSTQRRSRILPIGSAQVGSLLKSASQSSAFATCTGAGAAGTGAGGGPPRLMAPSTGLLAPSV